MSNGRILAEWLVSGLVGGLVAVALRGAPHSRAADKPGPKVIRAEKIMLNDAKGLPRIQLGTTADGGASISLLSPEGRPRLSLAVSAKGTPILDLTNGNAGLILGAESKAAAILGVRVAEGREKILLRTDPKDGARIEVVEPDGRVRFRALSRLEGGRPS
jgi:hypothetical protein